MVALANRHRGKIERMRAFNGVNNQSNNRSRRLAGEAKSLRRADMYAISWLLYIQNCGLLGRELVNVAARLPGSTH